MSRILKQSKDKFSRLEDSYKVKLNREAAKVNKIELSLESLSKELALSKAKVKELKLSKVGKTAFSISSFSFEKVSSSLLRENYFILSKKYSSMVETNKQLNEQLKELEVEKKTIETELNEVEIENLKQKSILDFVDIQLAEKDIEVKELRNKIEQNVTDRNVRESMFILISMLDLPQETISPIESTAVNTGIRSCCLKIAEEVDIKLKKLQRSEQDLKVRLATEVAKYGDICAKLSVWLRGKTKKVLPNDFDSIFNEMKRITNDHDQVIQLVNKYRTNSESIHETLGRLAEKASLADEQAVRIETLEVKLNFQDEEGKNSMTDMKQKISSSDNLIDEIRELRQENNMLQENIDTLEKHFSESKSYLIRIKSNCVEFLSQWSQFVLEIGEEMSQLEFDEIYEDPMDVLTTICKINTIAQFCVKYYHDNCPDEEESDSKQSGIKQKIITSIKENFPELLLYAEDTNDFSVTELFKSLETSFKNMNKTTEKLATNEVDRKQGELIMMVQNQENKENESKVMDFSFKDCGQEDDNKSKTESKYTLDFENASFRVTENRIMRLEERKEETKDVILRKEKEIEELKNYVVQIEERNKNIKLDFEDTFKDLIVKLLAEVKTNNKVLEIFKLIMRMLSFDETEITELMKNKGKGFGSLF